MDVLLFQIGLFSSDQKMWNCCEHQPCYIVIMGTDNMDDYINFIMFSEIK